MPNTPTNRTAGVATSAAASGKVSASAANTDADHAEARAQVPADVQAQLVMLHLTDSALPTGGFSHSYGLETYLQRDIVTNPDTFITWLRSYLRQAAYNDGLIARFAAEVGRRVRSDELSTDEAFDKLTELDTLAHVSLVPRQVRDANSSMGTRMAKIGPVAVPGYAILDRYSQAVIDDELHGCPALVHGLALGLLGEDVEAAVRSYLMQLTVSLAQNGIRGIPIGQDAGQRVLSTMYPVINDTAGKIMTLTFVDLGMSSPGLEIAQIQHETHRSRMFMS